MVVQEALIAFDGKRVAPLREAVAEFTDAEAEVLTKACQGPHTVAATWIVKALLEKGRAGALDMGAVFAAMQNELPWDSQLHLLQSVQYAPDAALPQLMFIREHLCHRRTLLRVWALDAFVRLALVEPHYLLEARALVSEAQAGKGAMHARARALATLLA